MINCLQNLKDKNLAKVFENKKILITTRNSLNLKQLLTREKFELRPDILEPIAKGIYPC